MGSTINQELVDRYVILAHSNLEEVKVQLANYPELLNAAASMDGETPIMAAAHMGNRSIAEFLLGQGAPLEICTAAMMGMTDKVAEILTEDETLANAKGAHRIPLIFHAALSGDTAVTDLILAHGGGEGLTRAIHGAIRDDNIDMTRWFLERGADATVKNFRDQTALEAAEAAGYEAVAALLREYI
jgi:uncharacterized protein